MVVGYDSTFEEEVVVEKVKEGVNGTGQKFIRVVLSNGETASIVECEFCHKMPCPNGGDNKCSAYNTKEDATVTCQQCYKPKGDGHNGTCYRTIDWNNGGKITCHHYD